MRRLDGMAVVKTNRALPAATMMLMLLGGWHWYGLLCCPMIKFTYVNAAPALQLYSNCNVILCKTHSSLQSFLAAFEGFLSPQGALYAIVYRNKFVKFSLSPSHRATTVAPNHCNCNSGHIVLQLLHIA